MTQSKIFREGRDINNGLPATIEAFTEIRTEDGMFVAGPDYRVRYWDARTELLTGIPALEALDEPLYEVMVGEREDGMPLCKADSPMLKLARAGHCVPSCEARLRHPSGKERWVGVTVLVAGTGEGLYLVVLLRGTQRMHETLELAQALTRSPGRVARSDAKDQASDHSFPTPKLSLRQLEVLGLLAGGDSVKSIACELGIAEATARGHVQGLLQALGVRSQIEALAYARQIGLLPG